MAQNCLWCEQEFETDYPDKLYCTDAHRERAKKHRKRERKNSKVIPHRRYCSGCGELFSTTHSQVLYCTVTCKQFYYKQKKRSRREWYRIHSKSIKEKLLIDAHGLCGVCNESIDPQLPYPDPLSYSIDHIQPRARGGSDELENLQPAHLMCNIRKGASYVDPHENHS